MSVEFTGRELDVIAVLWERGPSTVAEVRGALSDPLSHNTVATMLTILENKGYVAHTEEGRAFRYRPLVGREEAGRSAFGRLADTVMAGVRAEGAAFFSGTTYHGERLMRISVSDWATDEHDVDLAVEALLRHAAHATQ